MDVWEFDSLPKPLQRYYFLLSGIAKGFTVAYPDNTVVIILSLLPNFQLVLVHLGNFAMINGAPLPTCPVPNPKKNIPESLIKFVISERV